MIAFTADQEKRAMRRDCRAWTELMVEAWYTSDYPNATDYPAAELVSDLRTVYFVCRENDIENVKHISLLGFNVLRANMLNRSNADVSAIVDYFLMYAQGGNVHYAQAWIEIYIEEPAYHGA
ncbi:hypothetical protein IV454_06305 [Massilia antarctica]|uniref:Uncharacterized protein n=1 Tax=Massilia antarctica TaxID=2765360 RepID=A0AA48WGF7_9BURK|nr:hypothetical protein [Massilia antarctica]QPI51142.1 hypothetical protein IV454_06305 [Massilia antarctica]